MSKLSNIALRKIAAAHADNDPYQLTDADMPALVANAKHELQSNGRTAKLKKQYYDEYLQQQRVRPRFGLPVPEHIHVAANIEATKKAIAARIDEYKKEVAQLATAEANYEREAANRERAMIEEQELDTLRGEEYNTAYTQEELDRFAAEDRKAAEQAVAYEKKLRAQAIADRVLAKYRADQKMAIPFKRTDKKDGDYAPTLKGFEKLKQDAKDPVKQAEARNAELAEAQNKDALWSYGGATVGGGALGALLGGEGNRLKGAIIGALLANAANYGRRKWKYGNSVIA